MADELNRVSAQRSDVVYAVRQLDEKISSAWRNPALKDEGVDELRSRLEELEREAAQTRAELNRRVGDMPQVRRWREEIEEKRRHLEELTRRRDFLADAWRRRRRQGED